jgi:hypothetical protein
MTLRIINIVLAVAASSVVSLPYEEQLAHEFTEAVQHASDAVERVLGAARTPQLPENVRHAYDDKYALVDAQVDFAVALQLETFRTFGITAAHIATIHNWSKNGDAVTLRFEADAHCTFWH